MDVCPTPETAYVLGLQATLASMQAQLDALEPHLPPLECTWEGTARATYRKNLMCLYDGFQLLQQHIADAVREANRAVGQL